jgi:glycerophosphoryl diester phosphodiesterase
MDMDKTAGNVPARPGRYGATPYLQAIPDILRFQLVTKSLLILVVIGLRYLSLWVLGTMGKVAVTSGDFSFLFKTWHGYVILAIGLAALFIFVAFELNSTIIFSSYLLKGEKGNIFSSMWQGFRRIYRFFTPGGIVVILYILLIAPMVGVELSISMTAGLNVPNFIVSEINGNPLLLWPYRIVLALFIVGGIVNIFILHGVLLDDMSMKESRKKSKALLAGHWKSFAFENIRFILFLALFAAVTVGLFSALPLYFLSKGGEVAGITRFLTVFFFIVGIVAAVFFAMVVEPFYIMKLTQLYDYYRDGEKEYYPRRERKKHRGLLILGGVVLGACLVTALVLDIRFEAVFPKEGSVEIIAHRGGGYEALENTVTGLNTAIDMGAYGSEIDIQRTLDGHYIVNHDTTFKRVAGVSRKPWKMTLAQIKTLTLKGRGARKDQTDKVATLEEMLDAAKGKIILFIELKGTTADRQMAEDVINMIKERDMLDECVLISLKYNIIDYIETTWPEVQTGCLIYASYGNPAKLNCDFLGLEEEAATGFTIANIHRAGKKALVWTPNGAAAQKHFLLSNADAVITDNVARAFRIREGLGERTDLQRIVDTFLGFFGVSRS